MAVGQAPPGSHLGLLRPEKRGTPRTSRDLPTPATPRIVNRWQIRFSTASWNASSSSRSGRRRPTSELLQRSYPPANSNRCPAVSRHAGTGSAFSFQRERRDRPRRSTSLRTRA